MDSKAIGGRLADDAKTPREHGFPTPISRLRSVPMSTGGGNKAWRVRVFFIETREKLEAKRDQERDRVSSDLLILQ
jgi:hypothetical protein